MTSAQSGTVVTTPLVATVPAGTSELVMELFTPAQGSDPVLCGGEYGARDRSELLEFALRGRHPKLRRAITLCLTSTAVAVDP